jgi:PAS domain S-box-containing protein
MAEDYRELDRRVLVTSQPERREYQGLYPDGRKKLFDTLKTPYLGPNGEVIGVLGISRDITERKAAEDKILQLYRAVEQSPAATVITNLAGEIEYVNPRFMEMTGYSAAEVLGRNPRILKSGETTPETYRELWQTIRAGKTWHGGFHNRRKNGDLYWETATISPIVDASGRITHFLSVKEDITELKQTAEQLQRTNQSLETANARAHALVEQAVAASCAKSEFLANMSHEIRTPMNGVMGMTELLLKTKLDGRQSEFATAIAQSAQALLQVLDDVLDLSKVEAGKLTIISEEFSVRAVLDGVLEVAGHREPEKGVSLAAILHPGAPDRVQGDPHRLRQILLNLVGNAIKFTSQGEVTVRVQPVPGPGDRGDLRFEVKDTGIGMTTEQVEGLFQRFVQAEATTSQRFGGTGLGLAISHRLVGLMGGRIGVQSEPGKGSTFWFELPFGPADQSAIESSHPALALVQVILGLTHPGLAESLREQCRSWGVGCTAAGTARELVGEAESAAGRRQTAIVVCEDEFFDAGGAELRQELLRLGQRACCLLLASPANALAREAEPLHQFQRVLIKPVKHSQLFDALVTAVAGKVGPAVVSRVEPAVGQADNARVARLRILLAEDHPMNRKVGLLMLERLGVTAAIAENGLQVMAAVARQDYDVILMDCNMPEMDGYKAAQAVRHLEESRGMGRERRTWIVALTANALKENRARCLAGGMDDFLSKPFNVAELRRALLRCVGTGGGASVAAGAVLDQLAAELDRESVALMVGEYIKDLPVRLAGLERDLAGGKREEVERTAHSLRGASAQVGLGDLSAQFEAVEAAAATGDLDRAREQVKPLGATAQAAATTLRQWLAKL